MRARARILGWLFGATLAAGAVPARATDATAVAAFDEAQSLMKSRQYEAACKKFAESNRLDPQLGVLMHLADCHEKTGKLASAWAHFRDAAEIAEKRGDRRAGTARKRAAALEPRVPRLTVRVPQGNRVEGLQVLRDGIPLGDGLWGSAAPVDPGEHLVEASAEGYQPWSTRVAAAEGGGVTVEVPRLEQRPQAVPEPSLAPIASAPPGAEVQADTTRGSPGQTQRILGFVAGGLGIVGLGVGTYFLLDSNSKVDERDSICAGEERNCPAADIARSDALTEDARTSSTIGGVGLAAGGVLLATGVVLILTAPSEAAAPPAAGRLSIAPAVGPRVVGVTAHTTF